MLRKILVMFFVLILQSCASNKGYVGEKKPDIEKIDDLTVGDYMKGYPRKVKVLPGDIKITVKFDTMTFGKALVSGLAMGAGGAIGGAIAGSINNSEMANNEMLATVEKGKSYKINFSSETHSISDLKIWIEPFSPKTKKKTKK